MSEKKKGRPKKDGKKKQIIIPESDLEKLRKVMPGLNESDLIRRGVNLAANTYEKEIRTIIINDAKALDKYIMNPDNPDTSNGVVLCHAEHYDELKDTLFPIKCEEIIGLSEDRFRVKIFKENWKYIDDFLEKVLTYNRYLDLYELDTSFNFYRVIHPNKLKEIETLISDLRGEGVKKSQFENTMDFYRNYRPDEFNPKEVLDKMSYEEVFLNFKDSNRNRSNKGLNLNNSWIKELEERLRREDANIKNTEEKLKKLKNLLTEGVFDKNHGHYSTVKKTIVLYEKSLKTEKEYKNKTEAEIEKLTAENNKLIQVKQAKENNYFQFDKQDISSFKYKTETYGAQIREHINSIENEKSKINYENYVTELYKYRLNLIEDIQKKDYYTEVFTLLDRKIKQLSNEKSREFNSIKPSIKKLITEIFETLSLWNAEGQSEQSNIKYTEVDYEKIMDDLAGKHISRFSFNCLENVSVIKDLYHSTQTIEGIQTSLLNLYLKYPYVSHEEKENLEKKFSEIDKISNSYNLMIDKSEILETLRGDLIKRFKDSFSVMSELKKNGFFSVKEKQFERQQDKKRELKEKERKNSIKDIDKEITVIKGKIRSKYKVLPKIEFTIKSQSYLVFEHDQKMI